MRRPMLLALTLCGACVAPDDAVDDDLDSADDGGKGDRGEYRTFVEVDPTHSSAAFRSYVGKALTMLEADGSRIAKLTASSIRGGRVKIDELVDLTCWDFERARQEVSVPLDSSDWADLREPGSEVAEALTGEIDGYMWSNRIYVSRGQPTRLLAATLVHETNHVINQSEVGYWDDLPTSAFLHEYRAFYAESLFDPEAYEDIDLVDHVIELYDLDRAGIHADVLEDPLTPRLLPDTSAWKARATGTDALDVEADCPGR